MTKTSDARRQAYLSEVPSEEQNSRGLPSLKGMLLLSLEYATSGSAARRFGSAPRRSSIEFWDRICLDICRVSQGLDTLYVNENGDTRAVKKCKACAKARAAQGVGVRGQIRAFCTTHRRRFEMEKRNAAP